MKQSKAFSYAVAFLLPCTVALAQDQKSGAGSQGATGKQPDLFNMALEDVLNMDVSTASKLHVKGTQSPGNLVVVTQDQIRRYGYRTVGEALERVPGFLNSKLGAFAFIGYRGLSPQSVTGNSRILVMIDGVRYNEWNFDQASLNERFPLDIESVDRIEVLKGAGSAIWGTNALFAVVNVISKNSSSDRAKQVLVERGANNRNKAYTSWAGETEDGFKYFASTSFTDEDNDISAYYPAFDAPETTNGIARDPYHQQTHRASLKMNYGDLYSNTVYSMSTYNLGTSVDFLYGDGGTVDYMDLPVRSEVGYKTAVWEEQEGEFLARSYYTYDRYRVFNRFPNPDAPPNNFRERNRFNTQAAGAEVRYSQRIVEGLKAVAGVEVTRVFDNDFGQSFSEVSGSEQLFEERQSSSALRTMQSYFFDLMYSPIEEATLYFGGRLDKFTDLDSVFGPRVSLVLNPVESTTVRFVYSKGLRNPSIAESITSEEVDTEVSNENLDYYEAFVEHRVDDWLTVSTSVFLSELSDTVGFVAFEDGGQRYGNTRGLRSRGVEVDLRAQLANNIESYGIFTYAEGRDKDRDAAFTAVPRSIGRLGLSFGNKMDAIAVSPEVVFGDGTRGNTGKEFDPYTLVNLTLTSYPTDLGFNLSASIYNIFDEDYVRLVGANPDDVSSERAVEAGREFRVQAKWDF